MKKVKSCSNKSDTKKDKNLTEIFQSNKILTRNQKLKIEKENPDKVLNISVKENETVSTNKQKPVKVARKKKLVEAKENDDPKIKRNSKDLSDSKDELEENKIANKDCNKKNSSFSDVADQFLEKCSIKPNTDINKQEKINGNKNLTSNKSNLKKKQATPSKNIRTPDKKSKKTDKVSDKKIPDNHKITDYFTQRKSNRKPAAKIILEKEQELVTKILNSCEDGLEIKEFPEKGRGVVSSKYFLKGDFVVEYAGDLIDITEAKEREIKYAKDKNIGCYMYYFEHKNKQYCVDGTAESGKLGRLVNHSRKGNLISRIVEVNTMPRLVLFAKVDIEPGLELLYDYGDRNQETVRNHPWLAL